jgi:hypothetical protein
MISSDLLEIGLSSTDTFIQQLFQGAIKDSGNHSNGGKRQPRSTSTTSGVKKTLGGQFKTQLSSLMTILNQSQPHFVRCMKSNMEKMSQKFDSHVMLTQLRYSGLIEVCRIRQNGFPHRYTFDKFYQIYYILNSSAKSFFELLKYFVEKVQYLSSDHYFVGHTKIFLKYETGLYLEQVRNYQITKYVMKFQKMIRGWLVRKRFQKILIVLKDLKNAMREQDCDLLERVLVLAEESLISSSVVLNLLVSDAQSLFSRLKLEKLTRGMLENALGSLNRTLLTDAINKAMTLIPPYTAPLVDQCREKLSELENKICEEEILSIPVTPQAPFPPPPPPPRNLKSTRFSRNDIVLASLQTISPMLLVTDPLPPETYGLPPPPPEEPLDPLPPPPPLSERVSDSPPPPPPLLFDDSLPPPPPALPQATFPIDRISDLTDDGDVHTPLLSERSRFPKRESFKRQESRSLSPKINRVEVRPFSSFQRSKSPPPNLETKDFTERFPNTNLPPLSNNTTIPTSQVRRTIIRKRVSQEEFDEMRSLQEALSDVIGASDTDEGLSTAQFHSLKAVLSNIKSSGNCVSNEVTHLVLANEELLRAKQQIELQKQMREMTDSAPRWKVRNRLQQAAILGMNNFSGEIIFSSSALFSSELLISRPVSLSLSPPT